MATPTAPHNLDECGQCYDLQPLAAALYVTLGDRYDVSINPQTGGNVHVVDVEVDNLGPDHVDAPRLYVAANCEGASIHDEIRAVDNYDPEGQRHVHVLDPSRIAECGTAGDVWGVVPAPWTALSTDDLFDGDGWTVDGPHMFAEEIAGMVTAYVDSLNAESLKRWANDEPLPDREQPGDPVSPYTATTKTVDIGDNVDRYEPNHGVLTVGGLRAILEGLPEHLNVVVDDKNGWWDNVSEVIVPLYTGHDTDVSTYSCVTLNHDVPLDSRQF